MIQYDICCLCCACSASLHPFGCADFSRCFGPHEPCLAPYGVGRWPYFGIWYLVHDDDADGLRLFKQSARQHARRVWLVSCVWRAGAATRLPQLQASVQPYSVPAVPLHDMISVGRSPMA